MNKPEMLRPEAVIRFDHNDFAVVREGAFVRCAVTGAPIRIEELRYWNVELQEAYRGPAEALQRWKDLRAQGKV
jgi:hypothetical protein